jgi:hypothetical protein
VHQNRSRLFTILKVQLATLFSHEKSIFYSGYFFFFGNTAMFMSQGSYEAEVFHFGCKWQFVEGLSLNDDDYHQVKVSSCYA